MTSIPGMLAVQGLGARALDLFLCRGGSALGSGALRASRIRLRPAFFSGLEFLLGDLEHLAAYELSRILDRVGDQRRPLAREMMRMSLL